MLADAAQSLPMLYVCQYLQDFEHSRQSVRINSFGLEPLPISKSVYRKPLDLQLMPHSDGKMPMVARVTRCLLAHGSNSVGIHDHPSCF